MLYYVSLITSYPVGRDIHLENYFIRQVISQGYWNYNIPHAYNAMLSDVMVGTFYSLFCGMSSTSVLKVIYPALFAFVPLGLFLIWKDQTNEEMSFLSAILFISYFGFYFEITQVPRQEIAEIFLISFLLLITKKTNIIKIKKVFLIVIFLVGIAVSHYGTSYILMMLLVGAYLLNVFKIKKMKTANKNFNSESALNLNLVIYTFTIVLSWYLFIGGSINFDALINIFQQISGSLQEFLDPYSVEGLNFIVSQKSFTHNITKVIYLVVNFLISVGFFVSFKKDYLKRNFSLELNFNQDYESFSIFSYTILLVSLAIPYTSTQIGTPRLYHISLIFLAPYFTIGFIFLIRVLSKKLNKIKNDKVVIVIFLSILFWFSTGLIYEVTNDDPTSISLNTSIVHPKFHFKQTEAFSSQWLSLNKKNDSDVFADENGRFILYDFIYGDYKDVKIFTNETYEVDSGSYIFLDYLNVKFDEVVFMKRTPTDFYREYPSLKESPFYLNFIKKSNKVYENSESEIYYVSGGYGG